MVTLTLVAMLFLTPAQRHDPKTNTSSGCGEGVTAHVRTFLHGSSRITRSIATLPNGETLPGEDKQQVCEPRGFQCML